MSGNRRRLFVSLAGLGLLFCLGCGDDGFARRYPVSGRVAYNGNPVESGQIHFRPVGGEGGDQRAASGTIQNGRYTLSTAGDRDGALPGEYEVTIRAMDIDMTEVIERAGGGAGRQDDIIAATKKAKRLIPAKYELAETSGLRATVEERSNTIDFELTD